MEQPLPPHITPAAIETARSEFLRLEALGAEFDHVVIARDVTIAELHTARREWFDRVRVALLTDGSLVVTQVRCAMYEAVVNELARQLDVYARANVVPPLWQNKQPKTRSSG